MVQANNESADETFLKLGYMLGNSSTQPALETCTPRRPWAPKSAPPRKQSSASLGKNANQGGPSRWKERVYKHPRKRGTAGRMIGVKGVTPTFPLDHLVDISAALLGVTSRDICSDVSVKEEVSIQGGPDSSCILYREEPLEIAPGPLQSISSETWQFLRFKNALDIPTMTLRRALLDAYIAFVHPSMPVLDLPRVLDSILMSQDECRLSPLLFQAMMFAASAFVETQALQAAGYRFRSDLRRDLFHKVKVIYESDMEADSTIQIQALLLISDWHDCANNPKDPYYWIGLAVSTAHRLGLHEKSYDGLASLRKRLWWCIYAQDIRVSLKLRRPRQIKDTIVTAGFLQEEDLEIGHVKDRVRSEFNKCADLFEPESTRQLNQLYMHSINLCVRIGRVLDDFYTPSWTRNVLIESPVLLVPKRPFSAQMDLRAEQAFEALAASYAVFSSEECLLAADIRGEVGSVGLSFAMQNAELHIMYHLARCILSHALLSSCPPFTSLLWKEKLRSATYDIISVLQLLCASRPQAAFPSICVPAVSLVTAIIVTGLDDKKEDQGVKDRSLSNYHFCMNIAKILQETHPAAYMISMSSNSGNCWLFR